LRSRGTSKSGARALGGVLLLCLAVASSAQAAPVHPLLGSVISGLDHACGVAVDSEGDVFASSAGDGEVKVFDSSYVELEAIANGNEPCGLAVDSEGRLYASEAATGNVVRYTPANYPFVGAPGYGAAEPIDSSGEAEGIAVDPVDDRLYVAKGTRVDAYNPTGTLDVVNEVQRAFVEESVTGGTYTLTFKGEKASPIPGETTAPIEFDASAAEVEAALVGLASIAPGDVSVEEVAGLTVWDITFTGAYGGKDIEELEFDGSGLIGGGGSASTISEGFDGHIGEGQLTDATGVAAYTYGAGLTTRHYLFVADKDGAEPDKVEILGGSDIRALEPLATITGVDHDEDPETPEQEFGFGAEGAYLAADPGTCPPAGKEACTAGHFFVYDDAHEALYEFEASGELLTQIPSPEEETPAFSFADAEPTAIAVDRSGGPGNGTLYVSSGAAAGAEVLAFGPLTAPSRAPDKELSLAQEGACGAAVDSHGSRYLAASAGIKVYPPAGTTPLATIEDPGRPCDLAVDSACNLWALDRGTGSSTDDKVVVFEPSACPPVEGTTYSPPTTCATAGPPYFPTLTNLSSVALDPRDDHAFVSRPGHTIELDSAQNDCGMLDGNFGPGARDLAVCGANGNVYATRQSSVVVLDESGTKTLAEIDGSGSAAGPFSALVQASIAVEQSNCHALLFEPARKVVEEYEASGAFVGQFVPESGPFQPVLRPSGLAVDNGAQSPNKGSLYLAYDDPALANPYDLSAFSPLSYGEPPIAATGTVTEVGEGEATLNGTVNPRGFEVEDCHFEYLTDAEYEANLEAEDPPFEGAETVPCAESTAEIGEGTSPVPVHADIGGLDPEERYRFRAVAKNEFGEASGEAVLFGPPVITAKAALPSYTEATLRATVDPSGLETECRFQYGESAEYGSETSAQTLPAKAAPTQIETPIFGLAEATLYHFRAVCENDAKLLFGPDQSFKTLLRPEPLSCPNEAYRTGRSAALPDCRAYELVTPADTRGASPFAVAAPSGATQFNNWLVDPAGEGAGESVAYFINGTSLPGYAGNGRLDGYRSTRAPGAHPEAGWGTELTAPSYLQAGGSQPSQLGVAADQRYWFWQISPSEVLEGTLDGSYLRTPVGLANPECNEEGESPPADFELVGCGSLGTDPDATGRFLSAGGTHVIFSSRAGLETGAAPEGTSAIYDREAGQASAEVVSLKPGGEPFASGEDATYLGATEDGQAIAFEAGGTLYVRRGNEATIEVTSSPHSFAGLAEDAGRVFYADKAGADFNPGALFAFDLDTQTATPIAEDSRFVNVPADGSAAYLTSEEVLDEAEEGTEGQDNLYLWDGSAISFIAILDPADLSSNPAPGLNKWTAAIAGGSGTTGRADDPSRSSPDGEALLFESGADLTSFESEGHVQIYRYHAGEESLTCVSCAPAGTPPSSDAALQSPTGIAPTAATTLIPNVTEDGQAVLFESEDQLLPEDANGVRDVYEWKAFGEGTAGDCDSEGGCLALISSGQGERDSFLYGMSADAHDIFFTTLEKLHGQDITGGPSIYDARKEGGIPDPPALEACQADACRGEATPPPLLPGVGADTRTSNGVPKRRCPKGKRKVKSKGGKVRCVKKTSHKRRGANRKGRAAR
jgi:sugar lactone lactonase YvrE